MRWLSKIILSLIALFILALTGFIVFINLPSTQAKIARYLERYSESQLGAKLVLKGFKFKFLSGIADADNLRVEYVDPGGYSVIATAETVEAKIPFVNFFKSPISITEITSEKLDLNVSYMPPIKSLSEDVLGAMPATGDTIATNKEFLRIEAFKINHGQIDYKDHLSNYTINLKGIKSSGNFILLDNYDYSFNFNILAEEAKYDLLDFSSLELQIAYKDGIYQVQKMKMDFYEGKIEGNFDYSYHRNAPVNINLKLASFPLEPLSRVYSPYKLYVAGALDANISLYFPKEKRRFPMGRAFITVKKPLEAPRENILYPELELVLKSSSTELMVKKLEFNDGNNKATLRGKIGYKGQLDLALDASIKDLKLWGKALGVENLAGRIEAVSLIKGKFPDIEGEGILNGDEIAIPGANLSTVRISFTIRDNLLSIEPCFIEGEPLTLDLTAYLTLPDKMGFLDILERGYGTVNVSSFKWKGEDLGTLDAIILQLPDQTAFNLQHSQNKIILRGRYSNPGTPHLSSYLALSDFKAKPYLEIFYPDLAKYLDFLINMEAKIEGNPLEVKTLQGFLYLNDLKIDIYDKILSLKKPYGYDLNQGTMILEDFALQGDGLEISLQGKIYGDGKMEILSNWEAEANKLYGELDFAKIEGKITGKAELGGVIAAPLVKGKILIASGRLENPNIPSPIVDIIGEASFDNNKLNIEGIRGNFKEGKINISGVINYPNYKLSDAQMKMEFNVLPYYMAGTLNSKTSGEMELVYNNGVKMVKGDIKVDRLDYFRPFKIEDFIAEGETTSYLDLSYLEGWRYFLKLVSDNSVYIQNELGNLRCGGNFTIDGYGSKPIFFGNLTIKEGTINAMGTKFDNVSGFLAFEKGYRVNPLLNIKAETKKEQYKVKIFINGYVNDFKMELISEPPLEDFQIVALLATGRIPDQVMQDEPVEKKGPLAHSEILINQTKSSWEKQLARIMGMDTVNIQLPVDSKKDLKGSVILGKELSDKLVVTYIQKYDKKMQDVIRLDYKFSENLWITGEKSEKGYFVFGPRIHLEF